MKIPVLSKTAHILIHVGLIAIQVGNAAGGFLPFPANIAVAGGAAAAQAIIAISQHKNPLGG